MDADRDVVRRGNDTRQRRPTDAANGLVSEQGWAQGDLSGVPCGVAIRYTILNFPGPRGELARKSIAIYRAASRQSFKSLSPLPRQCRAEWISRVHPGRMAKRPETNAAFIERSPASTLPFPFCAISIRNGG